MITENNVDGQRLAEAIKELIRLAPDSPECTKVQIHKNGQKAGKTDPKKPV